MFVPLLTRAALLLSLATGSHAATLFAIDPWIVPPNNFPYPVLNASCGDLVQFVWAQGEHGVFRLFRNSSDAAGICPEGRFDATTGVELVAINSTGNYTYTVQQQDTPYTWLVCQSYGHCERGQKLRLNVTCPENFTVAATRAPETEMKQTTSPFAGNGSDLTQAFPAANESLADASNGSASTGTK